MLDIVVRKYCKNHTDNLCHWDCEKHGYCMIDKLSNQTRYVKEDNDQNKWEQIDHVLTYGE